MIFVKGSYGSCIMDREVSSSNGRELYSTRTSEKTISGIRQSKDNSKPSIEWWSGSRKDNRSQSDVQRDRMRFSSNQWF